MTVLATHCTSQIDTRIAGLTPAAAWPLFSTLDHATPAYVWNADSWTRLHGGLPTLDLSCFSPWNSAYLTSFCPTAVTPWHVLLANHAHPGVGSTVRFIKADGTVITRTIAALQKADPYKDILVAKLDSSLEGTGIGIAKILPQTWNQYLDPTDVPVLTCKNNGKLAVVTRCQLILDTWSDALCGAPLDETQLSFYQQSVSGDSSSPSFFVINGELALLFTAWRGGPAGSFVTGAATAVNAAIATLGAEGCSLTAVDLSSFDLLDEPYVYSESLPDPELPEGYTLANKYLKSTADNLWSNAVWSLTPGYAGDPCDPPADDDVADCQGLAAGPMTLDESFACGLVIDSVDDMTFQTVGGLTYAANFGDGLTSGKHCKFQTPASGAAATIAGDVDDANSTSAMVTCSSANVGIIFQGAVAGGFTMSGPRTTLMKWTGAVEQPAGWTFTVLNSSSSTGKFDMTGLVLTNLGTVNLTSAVPSNVVFAGAGIVNSGAGVFSLALIGAGTFTPQADLSGVDVTVASAAGTITLGKGFHCNLLTLTSGTLALAGYVVCYHALAVGVTFSGAGGLLDWNLFAAAAPSMLIP